MLRRILPALCFVSLVTMIPAECQNVENKTASSADGNIIAIQDVISQIREALIRVQQDLKKEQLPALASIDLTLKTLVEKDVGGTFKLWIISFGAKKEQDETHTVTIHLTPPSPDNPTKTGAKSITSVLETTIVSAAEGTQESGTEEYPLRFSGLTVELEFVVKKTGNGSLNIPEITPVTAQLSGQAAKNETQTIKIVFEDKKPTGAK